jgi:hypothetical protein
VHISHKHMKERRFGFYEGVKGFYEGVKEGWFGTICAYSMLMNVHNLCGRVRL